jgi:membrane carboxypeptidase/penicillin-binding protein
MARNGYIADRLAKRAQAEPVAVAARNPVKTHAPSAVGHVLAELNELSGSRFRVEDLFQGRISVASTVDARVQAIVNEALENGLARYEKRHSRARGLIQGSVVVLRNADAAILAEAGGREVYENREARYSDYNRVTDSLRQPGSAWKPLVYLAAFRRGLDLDTVVPDDLFGLRRGGQRGVKWIRNYDDRFKGPIPIRQALAESRNAAAIWVACQVGLGEVARTAEEMGIRSRVRRFASMALGASEVRLLELADAYRAMASGIVADPHVIARVTDTARGVVLYEAQSPNGEIHTAGLRLIQEGLRGVVRLPGGTAHGLDGRDFPIAVMGKTGTTNGFRDALFVGSTYGPQGITVAVRIGFDDDRSLGNKETGGRAALPIFREVMLRVYQDELVGTAPKFPHRIERGIDASLATRFRALQVASEEPASLEAAADVSTPAPPVIDAILACSR